MTVGIPNAGQVNALGMINIRGERSVDLQGRPRQAPVDGPAAGRRAEGLRGVPQAARCARAGGRARRAVRPKRRTWRRCRCTACRSRSRIRSTRRTCGRPAAATRATTSTSRRAITRWSRSCGPRARSSTPRRTPPSTTGAPAIPAASTTPDKVLVSTLGYQRSTWAGNPAQPLRHDARGVARLELGLGRVGRRQPGDVQPLRGDARLVPRPGQPQLGRAAAAAEGADLVPRRRHRLRHPQRSHRHPLPAASRDSAKVLDALKDPVNGYYDPRDVFTTIPRSAVLDELVRRRGGARRARKGSLKGMRIGIIRESMLTFPGIKADEPIVTGGRRRRSSGARRAPRRDAGRIDRSAVGRTTRRSRT